MKTKALIAVTGMILAGRAHAATAYDASLALPNTTSGSGAVYYGTGNGGTNYGWTVDSDSGIEIGLQGLTRFVGPLTPDAGTGNYTTTVGETGGVAPWDFAYSIDLQPVGSMSGLVLSAVTGTITITDANSASEITFNAVGDGTLVLPGSGPVDDGEVSSTNFTGNDASSPLGGSNPAFGAQNSENVGFFNTNAMGYPFLTGTPFNLDAPDVYTITLTLTNKANSNLLGTDTITVSTVTPEPSTWLLLSGGIGIAAWFARRRRTA
jgi:hypothetical protein